VAALSRRLRPPEPPPLGLPEDERADLRWEGEVWCGRGEALPWAAAAVVCAAVALASWAQVARRRGGRGRGRKGEAARGRGGKGARGEACGRRLKEIRGDARVGL